MRGFRFGLLPSSSGFTHRKWPQFVKRLEKLGYSTVYKEDHLDRTSYDPITMLSTAAAHTTKLKIGTLVFCVDFRHPVILAQAAATLQHQSRNRFEFGIGAGWTKAEYEQAGIPYHKPGTRIRKLDEALTIIKSMWTREKTSFKGKHYEINNIERTGTLNEDELPPILIGGGGRKLLTVAGKHADIVSIIPTLSTSWPPKSIKDYSLERVKEKIGWVKESALKQGRNPEDIEFALYSANNVLVSDDFDEFVDSMSKVYGVSGDEFLSFPSTWVGTGGEIRDKLKHISDETGITSFHFFIRPPNMMEKIEKFSEQVMKPLSR
jgi:probable F420-dependent oxidoreductase